MAPTESSIDPATLDRCFPRYTDLHPEVPVWCLTPGEGRAIHRFFDTSPISPSGRYAAVFRLPREDRLPEPGEAGAVHVIDLHTGEDRLVAETRGWEPQMGCNLSWGPDDNQLIFNDVAPDTWDAFAVNCHVPTGEKRRLRGPVYHVGPDGAAACAANPIAMRRTQFGYGVVVPDERVPRFAGLRDDDGLWITDTQTGDARLVLSLRDAVQRATPAFEIDDPDRCEVYGFHAKFNPRGDRLIFTIRFFEDLDRPRWDVISEPRGALRFTVLTCRPDGSNVRNAVPTSRWKLGGNHINWYPDGEHLSMNLRLVAGEPFRLVRCRYDGADFREIVREPIGSGHPVVHPNGRHVLTDTYTHEQFHGRGEDNSVLRWIDTQACTERIVVTIPTRTPQGGALRVDPHVAWDRTYRWVAFNGFVGGTRRVYLADFASLA